MNKYLLQSGWLACLSISSVAFATVPIPDLVLYGALYGPNGERVTSLEGNLTVKLAAAAGPDDPVIATGSIVFATQAPSAGYLYVLRVPREDGASATIPGAVHEGDTLRIVFDGEPVDQPVLVSDTLTDIRRINLNEPLIVDVDTDSIDDDWEAVIVAANPDDDIHSVEDVNPEDDYNGDGISNFFAYAMGLAPTERAPEKAPAAMIEVDTGSGQEFLVYTYRQSNLTTGTTITAEGSNDLVNWSSVNAEVTQAGTDGDSTILTLRIPIQEGQDHLFLRLNVTGGNN